jgi:hypothetical protein
MQESLKSNRIVTKNTGNVTFGKTEKIFKYNYYATFGNEPAIS